MLINKARDFLFALSSFFYPLQSQWPYEKHLFYHNFLTVCMFKKSLKTITVTGLQNVLEVQEKGKTSLWLRIFPF